MKAVEREADNSGAADATESWKEPWAALAMGF